MKVGSSEGDQGSKNGSQPLSTASVALFEGANEMASLVPRLWPGHAHIRTVAWQTQHPSSDTDAALSRLGGQGFTVPTSIHSRLLGVN